MKNPKTIAAIQFAAGLLILVSGCFNLSQAGAEWELSQYLAIVQIVGGPAFFYLGYKTLKTLG